MSDTPDPQGGASLMRVVALATALGVGVMTAAVYAVRIGPDGTTIVLDAGVLVAFVVGVLLGFVFWRLLLKWKPVAPGTRQSSRTTAFAVVVILGGFALFLYPLRYVSRGKLIEILIGMAAAAAVLLFVGWMFMRVKRGLDADTERQAQKERDRDGEP